MIQILKDTRTKLFETMTTAKEDSEYLLELEEEIEHLIILLLYNAYKTPLE